MTPSAARAQNAKYRKYRRYEISDPNLPPQTVESYKKAIRELLKRDATDPLNWYRNAFLHVFDCPHSNWWFLAWHRAYLGWFERICRELSGDKDFALPYWDWTKTPRIPPKMFEGELDPNHSAFIATFDSFRQKFEPAVNTLWSSFSQTQKSMLAQRGLNSAADFWASAENMFFNQPNARGLTPANPDLDAATQGTVAIGVIRSSLQTPIFAGRTPGPAGFSSAITANHNGRSTQGILRKSTS